MVCAQPNAVSPRVSVGGPVIDQALRDELRGRLGIRRTEWVFRRPASRHAKLTSRSSRSLRDLGVYRRRLRARSRVLAGSDSEGIHRERRATCRSATMGCFHRRGSVDSSQLGVGRFSCPRRQGHRSPDRTAPASSTPVAERAGRTRVPRCPSKSRLDQVNTQECPRALPAAVRARLSDDHRGASERRVRLRTADRGGFEGRFTSSGGGDTRSLWHRDNLFRNLGPRLLPPKKMVGLRAPAVAGKDNHWMPVTARTCVHHRRSRAGLRGRWLWISNGYWSTS
jgi:hypothetical protein